MGATKVFDIVINSKYTPTGVRGFLGGLSQIGEAGFNIRQGLIAPLQEVGQKVLDFIEIANPERIARLTESFDELGLAVGTILDDAFGPLLDTIGDIVVEGTALININKRLGPVYDDLTERLLRQGKTAAEVADEVSAASDRAVEAARRAQQDNPFATIGLNAEKAGVSTEQFQQILIRASGTVEEYLAALRRAGIGYQDLGAEIQRFNAIKGIEPFSLGDIAAAGQEFVEGAARIEEGLTATREQLGLRRSRLMVDIAIREGDRLQDVARRNARQLADIDRTRIETIQQASEDLSSELADIDTESSRARVRIEEQFQERIRQIRNQFGDQIEEAIRRRDARGLAQARKGQAEQLSQAQRDRDKSARDQGQDAGDRQKEAIERQAETERAAEEAAQRAIEQLQEQNEIEADERAIAIRRQKRDFDLAGARRLGDLNRQAGRELITMRRSFRDQEQEFTNFFRRMADIARQETQATSPLLQALDERIRNAISAAMGG